jgi:hypothetical protein
MLGVKVSIRHRPSDLRRAEIQCFANNWGIVATLIAIPVVAWFVIYWLPRWMGMPMPP